MDNTEKTWKSLSQENQHLFHKKVLREWHFLRYSYNNLKNNKPKGYKKDIYLENFVLHAKVLYEFFSGEGNKNSASCPKTLGIEKLGDIELSKSYSKKEVNNHKLGDLFNNLLSHLSLERIRKGKEGYGEWNEPVRKEIFTELEKLVKEYRLLFNLRGKIILKANSSDLYNNLTSEVNFRTIKSIKNSIN